MSDRPVGIIPLFNCEEFVVIPVFRVGNDVISNVLIFGIIADNVVVETGLPCMFLS